jgi:aspartokinase
VLVRVIGACKDAHEPIFSRLPMKPKITINGLKLSESLTLIRVKAPQAPPDAMSRLCHLLNEMRINIAFLASADADSAQPALCCIESSDKAAVATMVGSRTDLSDFVCFGGAVGLLSLYPHQASLKVLGIALQAFGDSGIPIHGLASSIGALTFVIDNDRLEEGVGVLAGCMTLPPNPASLRAGFKVRQTHPACRKPSGS